MFTVAGIIGMVVTVAVWRSRSYRRLDATLGERRLEVAPVA
jgi:hypothetical protein